MNAELLERAAAGNPTAGAMVEAELLRAWAAHDKHDLEVGLAYLAEQSVRGRSAAMDVLLRFLQRSGAIRPIIRRYVPPEEIDDVEQQTMIAVQRSVHSFQSRSRFLTWVHSVGINTALAHQRALARRHETAMDDGFSSSDESGRISSIIIRKVDLDAATQALTPEQRVAMRLWEEGHTYEDIAERVGAPVGTVRSRISRARERMRELIATGDEAGGTDNGRHDS